MKTEYKDAPLWLAIPISIVSWVATAIFAVFFVLLDLIVLLPLSALIDKGTRNLIHWGAIGWAKGIIAFTPVWKADVDGLQNIEKGKSYLIVCNHQSMLDILVLAARLPLLFKFLAKKELFSIPFVGWHMSLAKYIAVDRESVGSRHKALLDLSSWLKKGASVLFFPEGTRSPDGQIRAFKPAAFKAARDAGVDILPVVIDGTGDALPKHSLWLKKHARFQLSILPSVSMKDVSNEKIETIQEQIRQMMMTQLHQIRSQAPGAE